METTVWEEWARLSTGSCSHSYTNATTSKLPSLQNPKSEGLKGAMTRKVVTISSSCCVLILHSTHFPTVTLNVSHVCFYINGKYSPFSVISTGSCEEVAEESGCDSRTLISQYWSSAACSPWEWFNTWWLDAPGSSPSVSTTEGAATRVKEEIRNYVSKSVQGGGGGGDRALYVALGGLELTL